MANDSAEPSMLDIDALLYSYGTDGFGGMNRELSSKSYYLPSENTSNLTRQDNNATALDANLDRMGKFQVNIYREQQPIKTSPSFFIFLTNMFRRHKLSTGYCGGLCLIFRYI